MIGCYVKDNDMTLDKVLTILECGVTSVSLSLCLFRLLLSINLSINQRQIQDFPGGEDQEGVHQPLYGPYFPKTA